MTLGEYRDITAALFGDDSAAVTFLDQKIAKSPNGSDEQVIADETQMIQVLFAIHQKGQT